ncbi:MAG TPA: DapH/DapD/GlmU-related protein [Chitinispirillaceae bacterium]|nr:DapH/DapD/GlmU-related protein [Chitinispirillaceae bacterium]
METNSRVYAGVSFKGEYSLEDFCAIGVSPIGKKGGELQTTIGSGAVIRTHTVIYAGNTIGDNFQTGNKVNIREENQIGNNVTIGTLSIIEHHVTIKDNVRIHSQVFIPEYSFLEENAWIGPCAVFTNARYPNSPKVKENLKGPHIKRGAKIGANSTLLPGVVIGKNALIGAGTVVTTDVPDNAVVVGNPGKIINTINKLPY